MVRSRDVELFSAAVLELYAAGLDAGNYVDRAFRFISRLVPSDLAGFGGLDTATRQLSASFDHHPPALQSSLQAYGQLMHKYPPFSFDPEVNGGKPYSMGDFFTRPKLHDLDIYQEVHVPLGVEDQCYVHVPSEPGIHFFFGLFRAGHDFVERDKELLALAQPHLANARALVLAQSAVREISITPALFTQMGFTTRESDVIYWLTQGKANFEIATAMHIRSDSVSAYLRAIYEKMGVENRVAATVHAFHLVRATEQRARRVPANAVFFKVPAG